MRWRIEFAPFSYTILHGSGKENAGPDTLNRVYCVAININRLRELHVALCHPGITRMAHFVRTKNLPYSLSEICEMTTSCKECLEVKPQFLSSNDAQLVKATQIFERSNIDFKGPLSSVSNNPYILTVIDEYSRFPFAFTCADMTPTTIMQCLTQLFSIFGMCSTVRIFIQIVGCLFNLKN